ncbi:MAG: DNA (cytosine-5-)-methyltransferase [Lentisphaeraceae bacterium]|nr:DNA (cytosine-5-)-methyltransferase [Lentisphaeraceae bacterium]
MEFKLGELFCGPGGLATGAKLAAEEFLSQNGNELAIKHTWGVDIDPSAIETYSRNIDGEGICTNAMHFTGPGVESDKKQISDFIMITALAFGFPCNDFSMVGKQKGIKGKFGELYKAGINAINYSNPKFFVAENVSGIHSANEGASFQKILKELKESGEHGYTVTTHLYKFEQYGVPQARHRYLIVGLRNDLDLTFRVPAPTTETNYKSAEDALYPIDNHKFNAGLANLTDEVEWRLKFTPPGKNAWKLDEVVKYSDDDLSEYLENNLPWFEEYIRPLGTIGAIRAKIEYCRLHCTRAKMSHIYKRLDKDKPSYTITGSGGGGTHVYHWEKPRALTNRERARLQSFPDDFEFIGLKDQVRKQIGMAVPPMGAKIIFEAILKTFAGIDYPATEPSYTPLTEEQIKNSLYKRYRSRLGKILKNEHSTSISEFNIAKEQIEDWIAQEVSCDESAAGLVVQKLSCAENATGLIAVPS